MDSLTPKMLHNLHLVTDQMRSHELEIDVHQNCTQYLPERHTLSNFILLRYRSILKSVAEWYVCISDIHAVSSLLLPHFVPLL